jgi:alpha-glucosidase
MQRFADKSQGGWPSWALANHDVERVGSRWGGPERNLQKLRLAAAFQMCLRGSPCLYQGDELGLPEADIAFEDLQDPPGIAMWPEYKGRDGCRTPMPWVSQAADIGFGDGHTKAWLPYTEAYRPLAVDVQDQDAGSHLNFYRQLLQWRRTQPALIHGEQTLLPVHPQVMAFVREHAGQRVLCAFNFSDQAATLPLTTEMQPAQVLALPGLTGSRLEGQALAFEPFGGLIVQLA